MPTYHQGDIWSVFEECDLFLITTNATITKRNELVMGRGLALEAKIRFPWLSERLADTLRHTEPDAQRYGLMIPYAPEVLPKHIGAFQVKYHWSESARIELIAYAVAKLEQRIYTSAYASEYIALNFPGIGNGGLQRETVKPWVDLLPANVHIFER